MVENEETFHHVMNHFLSWQNEIIRTVGEKSSYTFVTCGDWDLKTMLPDQCQLSGLSVPQTMNQWINLKKVCSMKMFILILTLFLSRKKSMSQSKPCKK